MVNLHPLYRQYVGLEHIYLPELKKFSCAIPTSNKQNIRLIREEENRENFKHWQDEQKQTRIQNQWWLQY